MASTDRSASDYALEERERRVAAREVAVALGRPRGLLRATLETGAPSRVDMSRSKKREDRAMAQARRLAARWPARARMVRRA